MSKTKKMLAGVTATVLALGLAGCSSGATQAARPDKPTDSSCKNWRWDEKLGVYQCDDKKSSNYLHYYHGGSYFGSSNQLKNDSTYKTYSKSNNFAGKTGFFGKSGIGSGSKGGFGG